MDKETKTTSTQESATGASETTGVNQEKHVDTPPEADKPKGKKTEQSTDANMQELLSRMKGMEKRNDDLQKLLENERREAREFKRQHMAADDFVKEEQRVLAEREARLRRAQVETAVTKKFALEGIAIEDDFADVFPFLAAESIEDAERMASALSAFIRRREDDAVTKAHEEIVRSMPQSRGSATGGQAVEKGSFGALAATNKLKSLGLSKKQ